jgi:FAD dependent oxidoreductase
MMKRRNFINRIALSSGAVLLGSQCKNPETGGKNDSSPLAISAERQIKEPERMIEVTDTCDVLVVGGGPSGVSAAIAASRAGAHTILLERYNHLGGLWTGGLVLPLLSTHGINKHKKQEKVLFGIGGEIAQRLVELDMSIEEVNPVVDPEAAKYVMDQMMQESGVLTYNHSWASNLLNEDNTIKAVFLETKSGRVAIKPKVVIDCTGDGDIFHLAGEEYSQMQYGIGLVHRLGNIDRIDKSRPGYKKMQIGQPTPLPSVNWVNMAGTEANALDFKKLSELQQQQRIDIWNSVQKIRSTPGYEEVFLLDTAAQQGVRMSRILKGQYQLTLEDSMSYKNFDDVIGIVGAWTSFLYKGKRVDASKRPLWQIPYRSLVPKKTNNLLVAGRCFSFTEDLFQDARIIGTCLVTGHAAGVAASLASQSRQSTRDLDVSLVQKVLLKQKAYLG